MPYNGKQPFLSTYLETKEIRTNWVGEGRETNKQKPKKNETNTKTRKKFWMETYWPQKSMLSEWQKDPQNSPRSIYSLLRLAKEKDCQNGMPDNAKNLWPRFFKGIIEGKVYLLKQVEPKWF